MHALLIFFIILWLAPTSGMGVGGDVAPHYRVPLLEPALKTMLFNSIEFLFFLPLVFLVYWGLWRRVLWQNVFIVCASYVFYGWWSVKFLLLITITIGLSYISGLAIERLPGRGRFTAAWWVSLGNIVVNVGILCVYKYFDFFSRAFAQLAANFGWQPGPVTLGLVLPVGISFYTFQAISYSVDVYRGQVAATRNIPAFFAYLCFFPQLVAGPIERARNLLLQFLKPRTFDYGEAVAGMRQMLWGLFKKIVLADGCGMIVETNIARVDVMGGGELAWTALVFTFQIYGDFSGYSDIAIGCARLLGIRLSRNFNVPFFSRNLAEFWRRWHITLNEWFVHYVYIPLGGNRHGRAAMLRNLMLVFVLSGLWHGAGASFIVWGVYNGVIVCLLVLLGMAGKKEPVAHGRLWPRVGEFFAMAATFVIVTVGFIPFFTRSSTITWHWLMGMATRPSVFVPSNHLMLVGAIVFVLAVEWCTRYRRFGLDLSEKGVMSHTWVRWAAYLGIIFWIMIGASPAKQFQYFQF